MRRDDHVATAGNVARVDDTSREGAGERANEFRRLWDDHHVLVRAYLVRRVGHDDADDLLGSVFEIAWRRWSAMPEGEARLWWLLNCAAKCCSNHRRAHGRRGALVARLGALPHSGGEDVAAALVGDSLVREVLGGLSAADREVLLLSVWDDLDATAVAAILGISSAAAHKRIARARGRFEKKYADLSTGRVDRTLTE